MDKLNDVIVTILAVRDCPAARRLCLDAWAWGVKHGEPEGVAYATVILAGVRRYVEHERRTRRFGVARPVDLG